MQGMPMNTDIKTQIIQELPDLLENDPSIRQSVWRLITPYFAPRQETDSHFDQMMAELRQMREESERKWAENQQELRQMREESERKWAENQQRWEENWAELRQMREESERKWAENQQELRQMREESERKWAEQQETNDKLIDKVTKQLDVHMGAIGARWGGRSEASFRNAMRGLLQEVADVQVQRIDIVDEAGEVFGHPANIELDIVIHNGTLIVCEIKSSISRGDVGYFHKKVQFYKKYRQQEVARAVMISPMVNEEAKQTAQFLGVHIYTHVEDVFS
jgi:hypothetical protein